MSGDFRSRPLDRRTAVSILAASLIAGCGDSGSDDADSAVDAAPAARTDVPLRILLVGNASVAEAIRLAWSMTHEHPLEIEVFDPADPAVAGAALAGDDITVGESPAVRFTRQMLLSDVAITPQSYLGEINAKDAAVRFGSELLKEYQAEYGKPLPAVINSLGDYGGSTWGVAVGAKVLARLAIDSQSQCETWSEYHDWVRGLGGKAAEPLAPGWAASSFLNRCASTFTRRWLFNRTTMKPEIDSEDYVAVLEQLAATAGLYASSAMTPGQIWQAIAGGELVGGIGYEVPASASETAADEASADQPPEEREEFDISVFDCPRQTETDQLWLGPQTPLACLSSGCRQTNASKQFIGWLSGGQRISTVRQQSELFSQTRISPENESMQSGSAYARWLVERLQTLQVAPGLVLPGADRYYEVLDRQVRRCLAAEQSAAEALSDAASQWDAITDSIGRDQQSVAWKRTLGFGG